MNQRLYITMAFLIMLSMAHAQKVMDPEYDAELRGLLKFSVPTKDINEVIRDKEKYVFLDAREKNEYEVSHIPGAIYVGYNDFDISRLANIPQSTTIVVYCSVGYRSEKITEKLIKKGFTDVANLYGSIFEWANCSLPLEDQNNHPTKSLHTYNKKWSQWVRNPSILKTW